ncbi:MAG: AAA family ATPase [Lachnospiraceae bacterium]|nr:AAA family ATPase [Lachnospiraceae bacterium]
MYLKTVTIKNFRSLKDITIDLDDKNTVLIGENNAGKTSFMDAIRIALTRTNGRYSFEDYDYYMDVNIMSPKDSEGIAIILVFQEREAEEWDGYIIDSLGEVIQYIENDSERASIILKVSSVYNPATDAFESKGAFLNNKFEEIGGRAQGKLSDFYKLTQVFYLQALRNIKDTFSSRSPLWGRFLKKANIPQEKLKELQESMELLNKDIISSDENLTKLVSALEEVQKVLDFQGDDLVAINALPVKSWELLSKAQLVLSNANHVSLPLEKHGQGTQSVTTILLFKAYIDILLQKLNNENSEALLMIEEPEAHLHPQAIRAVEKVLEELECQKIVTTHSPYFLQNCDLLKLRLFKKENGATKVIRITNEVRIPLPNVSEAIRKVTGIYANVFELCEDKSELIIREPLQENKIINSIKGCCQVDGIEDYIAKTQYIFSQKELYDLNVYVQRTRGELLFARKWILYEGQTEDVIIQYCAELLGYNLEQYGISGIYYRSNGSAGAFVKLAKVLGIDWVLLGDRDKQGENTKRELKKCGYTEEELQKKVYLTNEKDIESELIKDGFLADYETIVSNQIDADTVNLKSEGKIEKYQEKIIETVQEEKVENAYKLVDRWKERNMQKEEVPSFIRSFIERVCKNE